MYIRICHTTMVAVLMLIPAWGCQPEPMATEPDAQHDATELNRMPVDDAQPQSGEGVDIEVGGGEGVDVEVAPDQPRTEVEIGGNEVQ